MNDTDHTVIYRDGDGDLCATPVAATSHDEAVANWARANHHNLDAYVPVAVFGPGEGRMLFKVERTASYKASEDFATSL